MTSVALALDRPLRAPFDTPPVDALRPTAATVGLVRSQVGALLQSTPSYHALPEDDRKHIAHDLTRIAAYTAECMREICWQSGKLGQVPVVRRRKTVERAPLAQAQSGLNPAAANAVGRVTQETLRAVAFPTFVADLIKGTFNAIIQSNIQQMEAFGALLQNVTRTVDDFMSANISDAQASDWLAQRYPEHMRVQDGQLTVRDGADERPMPNFRRDLNLSEDVSGLDDSSIEEVMLPAARRRLAESRLQLLSTMVLMGLNRIVVTGGKIRATMGFHIDTTDRLREERATDTDVRVAAAGSFGFGPWSASASTSIAYVSSSRTTSDAEINVETDLTGEVELHFKSDYFPLSRFANGGTIAQIQGNTAVPEANAPSAEAAGGPFDTPPAVGGEVGRYRSPRTHRTEPAPSTMRPIGTLPEVRTPVAPTAPTPVQVPQNPTPAPTEPAPTDPAATTPAPTEPAPTEPAPTEPAPTDPAATTPSPTHPAATSPAPTDPAATTHSIPWSYA